MNKINCKFPRTLITQVWEEYLNRKLFNKEIQIIEEFRNESYFNAHLANLHLNAKQKNLFVASLTNLHGNCLFESLQFYGLCDNIDNMRLSLAYLLYTNRNIKGLFDKNDERTLKEMFNDTNEITHVINDNDNLAYKYTFEIMCCDLANSFTWARLPTELIMMLISKLFKIKIIVVHDTGSYVNEIDMSDCKNPSDVFLGHIGETHYVPLMQRNGLPNEDDNIYS